MFQKERLEEALNILEGVYKEMREGYIDLDAPQAAVYCQVEINRIVFKINEPEIRRKLYEKGMRCEECQIKCKNCRHYAPFVYNHIGGVEIPTTYSYCYKHGEEVDPDDSCELAERKGKE